MVNSKRTIISILVLAVFALVIVVLAAFFIIPDRAPQEGGSETSTTTAVVQPDGALPGITYGYASSSPSNPSNTELPKGIPIPDLDRPVTIPSYFLSDIAERAKADIAKISGALKENPSNAALWAELGLQRKEIEDYIGARDALLYAYALIPQNAVISDNLGVLYGYYLKDSRKAEEYFKKALELEPTIAYRYLRLYELYHDIVQDDKKTKAILERGLKAIPNHSGFTALLQEYQ